MVLRQQVNLPPSMIFQKQGGLEDPFLWALSTVSVKKKTVLFLGSYLFLQRCTTLSEHNYFH